MILKFRPWVQFVDQNEDTLSLLVHRFERNLKISRERKFNYELLSEGIQEEKVPPSDLKILKDNNLVESVDFSVPTSLNAENYFLTTIVSGQDELKYAQEKLSDAHCLILDFSKVGKENLENLNDAISCAYFEEFGEYQKFIKEKSSINLTVVLVDTYLDSLLHELNVFMLKHKRNWILVNTNHEGVKIGPFFSNIPTDYCFNCFEQRILSWEEKGHILSARDKKFYSNKDIGKRMELGWMQFQLIRAFATDFEVSKCFIQHFDIVGNNLAHYPFLPYPICPVCKP